MAIGAVATGLCVWGGGGGGGEGGGGGGGGLWQYLFMSNLRQISR
jgi:hypothetical protein